jgi:hypothetical protein
MRDCWAALRKNTFIQNAFHNFLPTQRKHTHTHTHTHTRVCIHENRGPVCMYTRKSWPRTGDF